MAQQDDVNAAIATAKASTEALNAATAKLTGLNIPSPVDTSGLAPAMADNSAAAAALSAAVDAEAAKINPRLMWALLAKAAFSLLVTLLEKSGILTGLEADAVRGGDAFLRTVSHLKTYSTNNQLDPSKSDFPAEIHAGGR